MSLLTPLNSTKAHSIINVVSMYPAEGAIGSRIVVDAGKLVMVANALPSLAVPYAEGPCGSMEWLDVCSIPVLFCTPLFEPQ
jgi:hypothetical protein